MDVSVLRKNFKTVGDAFSAVCAYLSFHARLPLLQT